MALFDELSDIFEIITPKGEAYREVKGHILDSGLSYKISGEIEFYTRFDSVVHEYDILRRKSDGKIIRIISHSAQLPDVAIKSYRAQLYLL